MRNLHWESRTVEDCTGHPLSLNYDLLVEEVPCGDSLLLENYGIRVTDSAGGCVALPGITVIRRDIEALLSLMYRNTVTPTAARDVTEDWLASR